MSEFLKEVPDSELITLAKQAENGNNRSLELLILHELRQRQLARTALDNPCIILGEN